jgi:hypothetical protein
MATTITSSSFSIRRGIRSTSHDERVPAGADVEVGPDTHFSHLAGAVPPYHTSDFPNIQKLNCCSHQGGNQNGHPAYLFFSGASVAGGASALKLSTAHFHLPSACLFQTSKNLPCSVVAFPAASLVTN